MLASRLVSLVSVVTLGLAAIACGDVTTNPHVTHDAGSDGGSGGGPTAPACADRAPFEGLSDLSQRWRVDGSLGLTIEGHARSPEGGVGLVIGVIGEATLGEATLGGEDVYTAQLVEIDASGAIARRLRLVSGAYIYSAELGYGADRTGIHLHVKRAAAEPLVVDPDGASVPLVEDEVGVVLSLRDGAIEWTLLQHRADASFLSLAPDGRMILAGQRSDGILSLSTLDGAPLLASDTPADGAGWLGTIDAEGTPLSLTSLAGTSRSRIDRAIALPDGKLVVAGRFGGTEASLTVEIPSKEGTTTLVEVGAGEDPEDDGFVARLDESHRAVWIAHLLGYPYGEIDLDVRGDEVFVHQPGIGHAIVDATGAKHDEAYGALGLTLDGALAWTRPLPTLTTHGARFASSMLHDSSATTWTSEPDGGIVVEHASGEGDRWLLLSLGDGAKIAGVRRLLLEPSIAWEAFPGCGSTWYLAGSNVLVAADVTTE